jgi:transposase-like protein
VKAEIVRELLENQVPASDLSERYGVNVNSIYNWRKQLLEAASDIYSAKHERQSQKSEGLQSRLQEQLREKNALIAELVEDNIALKKRSNGMK